MHVLCCVVRVVNRGCAGACAGQRPGHRDGRVNSNGRGEGGLIDGLGDLCQSCGYSADLLTNAWSCDGHHCISKTDLRGQLPGCNVTLDHGSGVQNPHGNLERRALRMLSVRGLQGTDLVGPGGATSTGNSSFQVDPLQRVCTCPPKAYLVAMKVAGSKRAALRTTA